VVDEVHCWLTHCVLPTFNVAVKSYFAKLRPVIVTDVPPDEAAFVVMA
jgi:hypothetical protein